MTYSHFTKSFIIQLFLQEAFFGYIICIKFRVNSRLVNDDLKGLVPVFLGKLRNVLSNQQDTNCMIYRSMILQDLEKSGMRIQSHLILAPGAL